MKYRDFYKYLSYKVGQRAFIGPCITIKLRNGIKNHDISISNNITNLGFRYVIFPIKIYGENIHHLNILFWDCKTKIIEKYEPFNQYLNFYEINGLIESLLYKLMSEKKIYFLKYFTSLNPDIILDDKNCGLYCVQYVIKKLDEKEP